MAKKKTENIKAAPVLRANSESDQPTPTPEQTETRTYQIMDPWKDRDVVNLVDVKAVDGEITEVKVNGVPAGGGGGGDFSTAEVTIDNSNNSKGYPEIYGSTAGQINVGGFPPTFEDSSRPDIFPSDAVQTYTVILYKGKAVIQIPDPTGIEYNVTTSGNITSSLEGYIVTGDGTITIS